MLVRQPDRQTHTLFTTSARLNLNLRFRLFARLLLPCLSVSPSFCAFEDCLVHTLYVHAFLPFTLAIDRISLTRPTSIRLI